MLPRLAQNSPHRPPSWNGRKVARKLKPREIKDKKAISESSTSLAARHVRGVERQEYLLEVLTRVTEREHSIFLKFTVYLSVVFPKEKASVSLQKTVELSES